MENINKTYERLKDYDRKLHALGASSALFSWDMETYGSPKKAVEKTAEDIGTLSAMSFEIINSPDFKAIIKELREASDLTPKQQCVVREYARDIEALEKIPPKEYREFSVLLAKAHPVWENAKKNNDFKSYAPVLEEIIKYTKRFISYTQKPGETVYETALDDYEPGFKEKDLEEFFSKLKKNLVPVVEKYRDRSDAEPDFMTVPVSIESQKALTKFIADYIGFDFERGVIAEAEHPFTTNLHNHDVRITTHYYDNQWSYALFSTIHEGGHALYELGIDDGISMMNIGTGTSLGTHESQSRLYENNIGRGKAFWEPIYEEVCERFLPHLKSVNLEDFYKGINYAKPSLIRTEADELTYPFHIMIRYEIEKLFLTENVDVMELPKLWNEKYKEYLGIVPKDDTTGILQDMHWSGGGIGYFPTYAIGTAIAAQIYEHLKNKIDIEAKLRSKDLSAINDYLRENIYKFGKMKKTNEILKDMTGEGFNPDYYVNYLLNKF